MQEEIKHIEQRKLCFLTIVREKRGIVNYGYNSISFYTSVIQNIKLIQRMWKYQVLE